MSDLQVTRVMRENEERARAGRDFRAAIRAGGDEKIKAFSSRFPDGCWAGQRCFIVAGGPSLKGFDFSRLRGERVIAINKAFYDAPFADIMFAMDRPLLDLITSGRLGEDYRSMFAEFQGAKLWLDLSGYSYPEGVYSIPSAGGTGWTKSLAEGLYHGQNSGYGALGLAIVLGADPIYLLGYDCAKGPAGEKNYHAGYPSGSNPNAMEIFKREIEAGAKLLQGGPQIVNLNPQSALTCFPFGDADKVIPAVRPSAGGITAITPTGDRPLAFGLCRRWMAQQTRPVDNWVVVDDGKVPLEYEYKHPYFLIRREPQPTDPPHTLSLNLAAALPHVTGDKIIIIEDDEYYAPSYIEEMARRLDKAEVVGICQSRYYHVPTGGYCTHPNRDHASLAQTAFRASFLPGFAELLKEVSRDFLDIRLWKKAVGRSMLFVDSAKPLYVGIKGLPGRPGIGIGHDGKRYRTYDGPDRKELRRLIGADAERYINIAETGHA